jgi:hypothetical protein
MSCMRSFMALAAAASVAAGGVSSSRNSEPEYCKSICPTVFGLNCLIGMS